MNGVSPDVQAFAGQAFRMGSWRGELPPTTSFSFQRRERDGRVRAGPDERAARPAAAAVRVRPATPASTGCAPTRSATSSRERSRSACAGGTSTDDLAQGASLPASPPTPRACCNATRSPASRLFEAPPPAIPEWLDRRSSDFIKRNCFAGVVGAVLELGKYAGSAGTSDATGISSLSPTSVCPGTSRRSPARASAPPSRQTPRSTCPPAAAAARPPSRAGPTPRST